MPAPVLSPARISELLRSLRERLQQTAEALVLPDGIIFAGVDLSRALEAIVSESADVGVDRSRIGVATEHEPGVRLQVDASPALIRVPTSQSSGAPRPPP